MPCPASDDGAKYEMSFKMTKPQAQALYAVMEAAYKEAAAKRKSGLKHFRSLLKSLRKTIKTAVCLSARQR